MVKLTEVEDEHFREEQQGPPPTKGDHTLAGADDEEDDDFTDTDSEISTDSLDAAPSESLLDRLSALRDIIPPSTRRTIARSTNSLLSWTKSGLFFGGKTMWIVSTSALLIVVPFALAAEEEKMIVEQEREQGMLGQAGRDMLTPGAGGEGAKPAL